MAGPWSEEEGAPEILLGGNSDKGLFWTVYGGVMVMDHINRNGTIWMELFHSILDIPLNPLQMLSFCPSACLIQQSEPVTPNYYSPAPNHHHRHHTQRKRSRSRNPQAFKHRFTPTHTHQPTSPPPVWGGLSGCRQA